MTDEAKKIHELAENNKGTEETLEKVVNVTYEKILKLFTEKAKGGYREYYYHWIMDKSQLNQGNNLVAMNKVVEKAKEDKFYARVYKDYDDEGYTIDYFIHISLDPIEEDPWWKDITLTIVKFLVIAVIVGFVIYLLK